MWEKQFVAASAIILLGSATALPDERNRPPDWVWNARMLMCALPVRPNTPPRRAVELAERLAAQGYNVALLGPHMPLRTDILSYGDPAYYPILKRFCDECHKRGIRVVLKTMTLHHHQQLLARYEPYAGLSAKGFRTAYHTRTSPHADVKAWYSCLNHPEIRKAHLEYLPKLMQATGVDGFMTDALIRTDFYCCVCEHCRRKFKRDTGFEVPISADAPFWKNYDDAGFRAWMLWRFKSVTDFLADINGAMRRLDPPRVLIEYYAPGIPSSISSATDDEVLTDAGSCMLGVEIGRGPASQYNWRYIAVKYRHIASLAQRQGIVPYCVQHHTLAPSCPFFFRSLMWAHGLRKWDFPKVSEEAVSASARQWDKDHEELLVRTQSPASVALVYSRNSYVLVKCHRRDARGRRDYHDKEYFGWGELLCEANIPYHSLVDRDLTADVLRHYRLVILPDISCVSDTAAKALRNYVRAGGRLVATGETSLYSGDGARLANPQLADLFSGKATGKGRAVSLPGRPGAEAFHSVSHFGYKGGNWIKPTGDAARRIMMDALGTDLDSPMRPVAVPQGVVVTLQRQDAPEGNRTLVHLLNLRCTEIEPDRAQILKGCEMVYPHVDGPVVIDVQADWPCRAFMVSADFDGRRPVVAAKAKDYVRLTVPELVRYAIVCVEAGEPVAAEHPTVSTPTQRPFSTEPHVSLTGPWQAGEVTSRPIGSTPCQAHEYTIPAGAVFAAGDTVQLDIPIDVGEAEGLALRYWDADYSTAATGDTGNFVKLVLVNGKEVARHQMLGDGSWVERRCRLSKGLRPNRVNVMSLRIEAVAEGKMRAPNHVWWGNIELWRNGEKVRSLAMSDDDAPE